MPKVLTVAITKPATIISTIILNLANSVNFFSSITSVLRIFTILAKNKPNDASTIASL